MTPRDFAGRLPARTGGLIEDPRVMALVLSVFFFTGATVAAISLLLPHPAAFNEGGIWTTVVFAFAVSALLAAGSARLPVWSIQIALALGTLAITRASFYSDDPNGFYSYFYVWVVLFAFLFFGRRWGGVHIAFVGATYAWLLTELGTTAAVGHWLTLVVTLAVAGLLVNFLIGRVRRAGDEAATRARSLVAIGDVSHELARRTDAASAGPAICDAALEMAGASAAALWVPSADGMGLTATATAGEGITGTKLSFAGRPSGAARAFTSGEPFFVSDLRGHPEVDADLVTRTGSASALWEPVLRDGATVAVVAVYWKQRVQTLSGEVAQLVGMLADEASIAIERSELLGRLERVARTDDLTGLLNRRAWDEEMEREIARARRHQGPLCVALLDLDRFKRYNDEHGHQAGDRLLKEAAAAWRAELRVTDVFARYGGEEFAVALVDCDLAQARTLVERIRAATPHGQTCSAGVALWDQAEEPDDLIARADGALYRAKEAGRDRTLSAC